MAKNKLKQQKKIYQLKKDTENQEIHNMLRSVIYNYATVIFATLLSTYIGYQYALYVNQLHENDMWFSHITQVEREISFRTETGLYYSYYKQMVLAPSISQGWYELTHDNKTEALRTINIVERFNIYQEIVLGVIYRLFPSSWKASLEYVYFYLYTIYGIQAIFVMAIFFASWIVSGTFIGGILANTFFILNRPFLTRIHKSAPLRESTALPFIFLQIAAMSFYLKKNIGKSHQKIAFVIMCAATFLFTLIWQFAQFVMLLQVFALYGVYVLGYIPARQLKPIFWMIFLNLTIVCFLMFGNDMLYSALVFSFSIATLLLFYVQKEDDLQLKLEKETKQENGLDYFKRLGLALSKITGVFVLTFIINYLVKKLMNVESDEHVYKFVLAKLGYGDAMNTRDFDARMYICNEAFGYMDWFQFEGITQGILFPVYIVCFGAMFCVLVYSYFAKTLRGLLSPLDNYPELVFHLVLTVFFGGMSLTTLRMKFLWYPQMVIFASSVIAHVDGWTYMLEKFRIDKSLKALLRLSVPAIVIGLVFYRRLQPIQDELSMLLMFKDKDTVELMEWISNNSEPNAAFAGTMQLMAGVKLCTDRPITNHPHYENKFLRERTKAIYQMYGKRKPDEVNKILHEHGANYIILENSICYSKHRVNGCHQRDIVDLANDHELDDTRPIQRFCHAIKRETKEFKKYFKKVFENPTFYMYKVL